MPVRMELRKNGPPCTLCPIRQINYSRAISSIAAKYNYKRIYGPAGLQQSLKCQSEEKEMSLKGTNWLHFWKNDGYRVLKSGMVEAGGCTPTQILAEQKALPGSAHSDFQTLHHPCKQKLTKHYSKSLLFVLQLHNVKTILVSTAY